MAVPSAWAATWKGKEICMICFIRRVGVGVVQFDDMDSMYPRLSRLLHSVDTVDEDEQSTDDDDEENFQSCRSTR